MAGIEVAFVGELNSKDENLFSVVQKIASLGAWELDISTGKTFWTDEVYAIHDVDPAFDHNKVNGLDFYHPDDRPKIEEALNRSIENHVPFDVICRFTSAKGRQKWVRASGRPVVKDGKTERIIGMFQDVTETEQIQRKLAESKSIAEAANLAKSQFLANISHEILTPMNAIIGNLHLALEHPGLRNNKYLIKIDTATKQLHELVSDVLDYAKIEAGSFELFKSSFDLQVMLEDLDGKFYSAAADRNLELIYKIKEKIPRVYKGDKLRIQQILDNIIDNAIKFTERGSITVSMEYSEEKSQLYFSVSDTGIGMSQEKQESLFMPFFQADSSTTRSYSGIGLGLTVVQKLTDLMGGSIGVESEPGTGTTFSVSLPLQPANDNSSKSIYEFLPQREPPTEKSNPNEASAFASEENLNSEDLPKLLLVDDDPENIELLKNIFKKKYALLEAFNGPDAINLAKEERPALILLDVMMPGMDGFEVCHHLKMDIATMDIPVIFVTAVTDSRSEKKGLSLGAMDYITKPISPAVVKVRVKNQIELKQARDKLTYLASTDELTGLPNRRMFDSILAKEISRHARNGSQLCLIMLDLDHFKLYNDYYGHVMGDQALQKVAMVIARSMRRSADFAARYGGEEFACILPETTPLEGAYVVAEKIRKDVLDLKIPHAESPTNSWLTISLGISTCICKTGDTSEQLIRAADEQLYRAKNKGRNQTCYKED